MREWGQEPQVVMTTPLLEGLDGVEKMSKSLGNAIGVTDPPDDMFGKIMSISDVLMWKFWTLLTDLRPQDIELAKVDVVEGKVHPKKMKMDLALQLVSDFHGKDAAFKAQAEFERRFAGAGGAVNAEEVVLKEGKDGNEEGAPTGDFLERGIGDVLVEIGLAASKTVARQKVREGAVSLSEDGQTWRKVESPAEMLRCAAVTSCPSAEVRLGKTPLAPLPFHKIRVRR